MHHKFVDSDEYNEERQKFEKILLFYGCISINGRALGLAQVVVGALLGERIKSPQRSVPAGFVIEIW